MNDAASNAGHAAPDRKRWDDLFDFLDPKRPERRGADRDKEAEEKYQEITRKLVCFFAGRGCRDAEDLATETVLRVAWKCREVDTSAYESRTGYFYGVARNVLHESQRGTLRESMKREAFRAELVRLPAGDVEAWTRKEAVHRCLEQCLGIQPEDSRRLIVDYYAEKKAAKIEYRHDLAKRFGKSPNALRIKVHNIRKELRACVVKCVHRGAGLRGPERSTS